MRTETKLHTFPLRLTSQERLSVPAAAITTSPRYHRNAGLNNPITAACLKASPVRAQSELWTSREPAAGTARQTFSKQASKSRRPVGPPRLQQKLWTPLRRAPPPLGSTPEPQSSHMPVLLSRECPC